MSSFLLLAALASGDAQALWEERLELFASHGEYLDDNVLRQPQSAGSSEDRYRVTSAGVIFDVPYSRQRLLGNLTVNNVRYDTFGQYDLDGHDGVATWEWRPDNEHVGKLSYAHRRALASIANLQAGVQSFVPNALTTQRGIASLESRLAARWRLALEASGLDQENEAAERKVNDLDLQRGAAGLSYVGRAANSLGLRASFARGTLPNAQPVSGMLVDNSYRQGEAGATGEWRRGEHLRLRAFLGRVRREYEELPQRDFADRTWDVVLDWRPTGKLEFTALAQRAISETEEIHVSFVFAERIALQLRHRSSGHFEFGASIETSDRRYLGEATQVLSAAPVRSERVSAAGLAAAYRPHPRVTLSLTLRREERAADVASSDYVANVVSAGLRLGI